MLRDETSSARTGTPTSTPLVACVALIRTGELKTSAIAADHVAKTSMDCDVCPEMVVIPAGAFIMGSPETEKDRDSDSFGHVQ
jgi:formylglycine-generating enzyme required for sulfatase activity